METLTVTVVVSLLMAILMSATKRARDEAKSLVCRTHLAGLLTAMQAYSIDHDDAVIPSYNMRGTKLGVENPIDGWGPILDQDEYARGNDSLQMNPYVCPNTLDVAGATTAQAAAESNLDAPKGYMDWPTVVSPDQIYPVVIPARGFDRVIRVAYWINADNPVENAKDVQPGTYFTASVGYGPDTKGNVMPLNERRQFKNPARLIALADGLYAGNQEATRVGDPSSRIGYRHGRDRAAANIGFADGHADRLESRRFPRKLDDRKIEDDESRDNSGNGPTFFANPRELSTSRQ